MSTAPTIWINAGETSGDLHGQLLAQALRTLCPTLNLVGMAGPAMRQQGVVAPVTTEDLSVMGFTEVMAQLFKIMGLLKTIKRELKAQQPDVIVLIDAPDFNFRVAAMARKLGIPVVYYISPKLWAWRENRVAFLRQHVTRLISILPFEVDFYARHNMEIDYVGHPLVDQVRRAEILDIPQDPHCIGILPGSRTREITTLLPVFARCAQLLLTSFPNLKFVLPIAPGMDPKLIHTNWPEHLPIVLVPNTQRYQTMRSCRAILAASGTVTLEAALLEVPTIVAYKFSPLTFTLARKLVRVPYVSLPNLILNRPIFPEFLQAEATPWAMAATLARWLENDQAHQQVRQVLATLPKVLGSGNAAMRAARLVLKTAGLAPLTWPENHSEHKNLLDN